MASTYNAQNFDKERSIGHVLNEMKQELKEFATTRVQMLRSEMTEKVDTLKTAVPALALAALLALTAWMLLTFALVFFVSMAFAGEPYRFALAFLIVGVVYVAIGALTGAYGYRALKAQGVKPQRTLRVLKQDQDWVQREAKSRL